jgi:hypothetical protein
VTHSRIPFSEDDMGYLFEEIHRAKSPNRFWVLVSEQAPLFVLRAFFPVKDDEVVPRESALLIPFSEDDMGYLFEEIHRAKSVVPPNAYPSRPTVLRWKKE